MVAPLLKLSPPFGAVTVTESATGVGVGVGVGVAPASITLAASPVGVITFTVSPTAANALAATICVFVADTCGTTTPSTNTDVVYAASTKLSPVRVTSVAVPAVNMPGVTLSNVTASGPGNGSSTLATHPVWHPSQSKLFPI